MSYPVSSQDWAEVINKFAKPVLYGDFFIETNLGYTSTGFFVLHYLSSETNTLAYLL